MSRPGRKSSRPIDKAIVLVGFMAAGKSMVGRMLAKRLGLPFVDTDASIEELYGMSISEIFAVHGEARFRVAERELISRFVDEGARVIAVGGGAFASPATRDRLKRKAWTIWLDPPFELILARLRGSAGRPLATDKSEAEILALWDERRQHYRQAHLRIPAGESDPPELVEQIVSKLQEAGALS